MSDFNDRPQFQPPQFQPPASPQGQPFGAPRVGPPTEPTWPIEVAPAAPKKKRSKGIVIGASVAVVALVGAGVFALTQIGGNDDKGGAASPTEAGENLVEALNNEDILGAVDLLLPGERDTFRQPLIDLIDNLKRLEVLDDAADPSKVKGIDIELADAQVTAATPAAPDITTISISATDRSTVDGEALPLGDIIINEALGGERPSETTEPSGSTGALELTTVEKDGRWYVSIFYSVAEQARQDAGDDVAVPDQGIALAGAAEPEAAVDQMIKAFTTLDLTTIIGGLNPNEAEALQRYAPIFLDEADEKASDLGVELTVDAAEYDVTGSGSSRHVTISAITLGAQADGETVSVTFADGCAVVTTPDDTVDSCKDGGDISKTLDDAGFGDDLTPEVEDLITTVQDSFDGFQAAGIAVDEVDGKWYVSPIGTGFDFINSLLGTLDSQELQNIIDTAKKVDTGIAVPVIGGSEPADTIPVTTETVPDTVDTVPETTTEDTVGETFPPVSGAGATGDDFATETEDFIESQDVADQAGFALHDADCETPTSTAVGTRYTCFAWDDSGAKFVLEVEITEIDGFTIQSLDPA